LQRFVSDTRSGSTRKDFITDKFSGTRFLRVRWNVWLGITTPSCCLKLAEGMAVLMEETNDIRLQVDKPNMK
jgi:hypothetical protein